MTLELINCSHYICCSVCSNSSSSSSSSVAWVSRNPVSA